jgi:hypothetical protein
MSLLDHETWKTTSALLSLLRVRCCPRVHVAILLAILNIFVICLSPCIDVTDMRLEIGNQDVRWCTLHDCMLCCFVVAGHSELAGRLTSGVSRDTAAVQHPGQRALIVFCGERTCNRS